MAITNFQSRALVGALYVIITVLSLQFGQTSAALYIGLIQIFCLYEFYRLTTKAKSGIKIIPVICGSVVFMMFFANQDAVINIGSYQYLMIPFLLIAGVMAVYYKGDSFIKDVSSFVFGWLYISIPLALLLRIGNLSFDHSGELFPYHGSQILVVFILIWLSDTCAYLVGRWLGKTPLAPTISPKKTIEGFIGGAILTIAVSYLLYLVFPFLPFFHFAILAIIVVVFGTFGDLFESKLKRTLGVKDSGTALGGHGGFLDRFDSILFAAPAAYYYLTHFAVM
ncbi:MAG: phosphatidate cytidylyltransferase [Bacteroidetes bacterium]|nr:phosphatidate cytidylyltransferase [Bacteroidota bacterium]